MCGKTLRFEWKSRAHEWISKHGMSCLKLSRVQKINKQRVLFLGKTAQTKYIIAQFAFRFSITTAILANSSISISCELSMSTASKSSSTVRPCISSSYSICVIIRWKHFLLMSPSLLWSNSKKSFLLNFSPFIQEMQKKKKKSSFVPIMANRALHSFHMKSFICFLMMVYWSKPLWNAINQAHILKWKTEYSVGWFKLLWVFELMGNVICLQTPNQADKSKKKKRYRNKFHFFFLQNLLGDGGGMSLRILIRLNKFS